MSAGSIVVVRSLRSSHAGPYRVGMDGYVRAMTSGVSHTTIDCHDVGGDEMSRPHPSRPGRDGCGLTHSVTSESQAHVERHCCDDPAGDLELDTM